VTFKFGEKIYVLYNHIDRGHLENFYENLWGCEDYRHMTIETAVVSNTSGSSRVRLVCITESFFFFLNAYSLLYKLLIYNNISHKKNKCTVLIFFGLMYVNSIEQYFCKQNIWLDKYIIDNINEKICLYCWFFNFFNLMPSIRAARTMSLSFDSMVLFLNVWVVSWP
jgi:hypothetical protein